MSIDAPAGQEWHQQPTVWIVLGVLAFTIVSSIALLILAATNPPQMVVDDYTAITEISARERERDQRAQALGLTATVEFKAIEGTQFAVSAGVQSRKAAPLPAELALRVKHSTLTALDRDVLLKKVRGRYQGTVELPMTPFDLHIADPDGSWRLVARLPGPVSRLELEALGAANP